MKLMLLPDQKEIHPRDMELHDIGQLVCDNTNKVTASVLRVVGGWIYELNNGVTFVQDPDALPGW